MLRECKTCGEQKPWDPTAKPKSKASGFCGKVCWDCYLVADAERNRRIRSTEEGLAKARGSQKKHLAIPENRAKFNAASVESQKKRRQTDAWYRLRMKLAGEAGRLLKAVGRGKGKDETILSHFGATREEVYAYLDIQLRERGFEWENHGWQWVGDHTKPLAMAQDSNELMRLCHLPNLQVLTPDENRRKGIEDAKLVKSLERN